MFEDKKGSTGNSSGSAVNANAFDVIGNAEVSQGGVYPIPGVYPMLYVNAIKMIRSRKGRDMFIAEFDVVETEVDKRPKGTKMSWVVPMDNDASPGNIRAFLAAVCGMIPDKIGPKEAEMCCAADNPCHGRMVRLEATNIITQKGKDFTKCAYHALDEEVNEQSQQLREAAGFTY